MGRCARSFLGFLFFACLGSALLLAQSNFDKEFSKGKEDLDHKNYKSAEKHIRAALKEQPDSWQAHFELANALFFQTKMDCVGEYERAHDLVSSSSTASLTEKRDVTDRLGVIYGVTHQYQKSIDVYQKAMTEDPDYPLYAYNLACTFAEKGDLPAALSRLREAYKKKSQWPNGGSFPDPRKDSSFQNYLQDQEFKGAMQEMGFQ